MVLDVSRLSVVSAQSNRGLMKSKNLVEEGLLTVPEAAEFLRTSRANLYALCASGYLPYCKIGRSRRIPRRAVIELAERSLVSPR